MHGFPFPSLTSAMLFEIALRARFLPRLLPQRGRGGEGPLFLRLERIVVPRQGRRGGGEWPRPDREIGLTWSDLRRR